MGDKSEVRACLVCGAPFEVPAGARGRPREYDTPECRRLRSRLQEVQYLLAWLRDEHGTTNERADVLHRELYSAANLINPRGAHKRDPEGALLSRF